MTQLLLADTSLVCGGHHCRARRKPLVAATNPETEGGIAHIRAVLGDQTCESLARDGETITTAEMAAYAYEQIDEAEQN